MSTIELVVVAAAGLLAGIVNAVAGGGAMLAFPVLVWLGLPPLTANVTKAAGLLPGYASSAVTYRAQLRLVPVRQLVQLGAVSVVGAGLGCVLLLLPPPGVFERVVPFLLVGSCVLIVVQPRLSRALAARGAAASPERDGRPGVAEGGVFAAGAYGAYFGAGLGILLFAVLALVHPSKLQQANALKVFLSFLISALSVVVFAVFGPVRWSVALVLAVFSLAGGIIGARIAQRLSDRGLRLAVLGVGVACATWLLIDL